MNKFNFWRLEVPQGVQPQWWYGVAYFDFLRGYIIAYPIPINWIVWILRQIYFKLVNTPANDMAQQIYMKGFHDGEQTKEREIMYRFPVIKELTEEELEFIKNTWKPTWKK